MRIKILYGLLLLLAICGYVFLCFKIDMVMDRFDILDDRLDAGLTVTETTP